jgi:hypothetical protein
MSNNIEDEQLVKLERGLHTAFDQEPTAPPSVEHKRERLSAGVRLVAHFIAQRFGLKYAEPFDELASVLADLNAGAWPELAVPCNFGTRRPDSSQVWRARALFILAIEARIASGRRPTDVLTDCSTRHQKSIKRLAGAKARNPRSTLSGWRKEFRQNRVKNSEASDLFAIGRECIEARRGNNAALSDFERNCMQQATRVFSPGD